MNRLQKKCLLASAGLHGLLAVAFLFGSAFFTPKPKSVQLPVAQFFDGKVVDELLYGGGNPNVNPAPPPTPRPPVVTPPKPAPRPEPKVEKPPEPEKPKETPKPKEPVKEPPVEKTEPVKPTPRPPPQISTKIVHRTTVDPAAERARKAAEDRAKAEAEARAQRLTAASTALRSAVTGLSKNLSTSTIAVEAFGPGGPAFINYGQLVKSIYDAAWLVSDDLGDDDSTVKARVVIARDGTVLSARIVSPSRNGALNRSVQGALDDVKFIAPFPEGAKDLERTFTINFNLKAKRQLG